LDYAAVEAKAPAHWSPQSSNDPILRLVTNILGITFTNRLYD
jgi:hypothetical protein